MGRFAVILPAAGRSTRFGDAKQKKIYADLDGRAVWLRAAESFLGREDVEPDDRGDLARGPRTVRSTIQGQRRLQIAEVTVSVPLPTFEVPRAVAPVLVSETLFAPLLLSGRPREAVRLVEGDRIRTRREGCRSGPGCLSHRTGLGNRPG